MVRLGLIRVCLMIGVHVLLMIDFLDRFFVFLGESYAKLDQLEKAEGYYRLALKAKPDHLPAHLTMAKLHHRQVRMVSF